jgi:hypothetical protein
MRAANEVGRFLLELLTLAALAFIAATTVDGWAGYPLALLTVLLGATFWGVLIAPRSKHRLSDPARLAVEVVYFSAAGFGLVVAGATWSGIGLATLTVANAVSLRFHDPVLGALAAQSSKAETSTS